MKAITLSATALMLLGTLTLGMADEISVDAQITAIQEAPAQERVQLMNQFKTRLATMNASEREAAITQLRTQTQTQARQNDGAAEGEQLQTRTETQTRERLNEGEANAEAAMAKTRTMTQERSRVNEMQQTQQMQQSQQMQQQQAQQQMQGKMGQLGDTMPTRSGLGQ